MARVFLSEEINDNHVVDVLPQGHMKSTNGGIEVVRIKTSAASGNISRQWITASAYLKDIIVTDMPSSTWLYIADAAASASASAAGIFPESTATGWMMKIPMFSANTRVPYVIPLEVILTAGMVSMVTGNSNANIYARILSSAR